MSNITNLTDEILMDPTSDDATETYKQISCVVAWSTLLACFLGMFSNSLSMVIFALPTMRYTPINLLLFGMSAIDFLLCTLALFVFVVPEFYGCYRSPLASLLSSYSFVYVYPLTSAAQTASIWLFLVVSYERWHVVCSGSGQRYRRASSPTGANAVQDRRQAIMAVIIVVVSSLAYNFVRFFEYRLITIDDGETTSVVTEDVLKMPEKNPYYAIYLYVYYVALFLLTHFAGPFFALVLVNGLILKAIYIARRRRRTLLTKKEKKEHRTSLMMAIVILMFLICHAPPFILNVIESIDSNWFYGEHVVLMYALNDMCNLLIVANAATPALIYYHFNRSYRDVCNRVWLRYICPWKRRIGSGMYMYEETKVELCASPASGT